MSQGTQFFCEQFKCTLTNWSCARRQQRARQTAGIKTGDYKPCRDCVQGIPKLQAILNNKKMGMAPDVCKLKDCVSRVYRSGLCKIHYAKRKGEDPPMTGESKEARELCLMPGCLNNKTAGEYCSEHALQKAREENKDPEKKKRGRPKVDKTAQAVERNIVKGQAAALKHKMIKETARKEEQTPDPDGELVPWFAVDLTDHPEIMDQLLKDAKQQFRDIENQVVFILYTHYNNRAARKDPCDKPGGQAQ